MRSAFPQALLFDLGGVLLECDFQRALAAWAPFSSLHPDALRERFRPDAHYEKHERGEIDAAAYFARLGATLGLKAGQDEIRRGWNAIFVGEITETLALVESLRSVMPCYALTNTNATHMEAWSARYPAVVRAFDRIFASHEMGVRKPERAAFERICQMTGIAPGSLVFFDDLAENVHAATQVGLQGVLVRSPADVASAVRKLGLLQRPHRT
jgi:putative hydrolase of the HAD superfamily